MLTRPFVTRPRPKGSRPRSNLGDRGRGQDLTSEAEAEAKRSMDYISHVNLTHNL